VSAGQGAKAAKQKGEGTGRVRPTDRETLSRQPMQARDALVGLGWKAAIARAAVDEAYAHVGATSTIEVVIREALRRCPRPVG